jgi:type III restriction enzyme
MSKINLTSLQTEKANLVSQKILEKLKTNDKRVNVVFKSPTGSGKTLMVSDVIKQIVNSTDEFKTSFIWIAPRKLHSQSKEKLESYLFDEQRINCSYFENLSFEDGILEKRDFIS